MPRLPLPSVLTLALLLTSASLAPAAPQGAARRESKKLLQQVKRFIKDFIGVKQNFASIESAIMQAKLAGPAFSHALHRVLKKKVNQLLVAYRVEFLEQLPRSPRVTARGIVGSSETLPKARKQLTRLAQLASELHTHVLKLSSPDSLLLGVSGAAAARAAANEGQDGKEKKSENAGPKKKASGKEREEPAANSSSRRLHRLESEWVRQWMAAQGFGRLTPGEQLVLNEVNRRRLRERLPPLQLDFRLCLAARDHSRDMVARRFFSHTSKFPVKRKFWDRAKRFGTTAEGENIANCPQTIQVVPLWMASAGHKRAILNPGFHRVGIGRAGPKYTMMFGRGKAPPPPAD